ncbi:hypothetical protein Tco_1013525 [Tanacetum coccineum]
MTNTPYPEASICRIQGLLYTKILEDIKCGLYSKKAQYTVSHLAQYGVSNQLPDYINRRSKTQFEVKMDDPNITMEEYIRLEEEKAHRRGDEVHLEELHVTWTHLEKKRTRLRTYTNIPQDNVLRSWRRRHRFNVTPSQRRPRRRHNIPRRR